MSWILNLKDMKRLFIVLALVLASSFNSIKAQVIGNGIELQVSIYAPQKIMNQ